MKKIIKAVVLSVQFNLGISSIIILNVAIMLIDYYMMPPVSIVWILWFCSDENTFIFYKEIDKIVGNFKLCIHNNLYNWGITPSLYSRLYWILEKRVFLKIKLKFLIKFKIIFLLTDGTDLIYL